jgi:hypothetical protein
MTFWHMLFGCTEKVLGFSIMGNPIFECPKCGRYWIVYGSAFPSEHDLTMSEAYALLGREGAR